MLGAIGDLVEDVVVTLGGPVNLASDTDAVVVRRRGGSAANVAVAAARIAGRARFIGRVGDDQVGRSMLDELRSAGVEAPVPPAGRTGTIVVLVHADGERTMLRDRATSVDLDHADPRWLDGLRALHVPLYSLTVEPLATTSRKLIQSAHERDLDVSIDASSASVIERFGVGAVRRLVGALEPSVLFCNEAEARLLETAGPLGGVGAAVAVARHGPDPAVVITVEGHELRVPAHALSGVRNTTGAGDAFAAGFMLARGEGASVVDAAGAGHDAARDAIDHDA